MPHQIARTPDQIGHALRRLRRAKRITQNQLGQKTGLRQATISGLESGEHGARLSTLFDVLAALDLELVIRPRTKAQADRIEDIF